MGQRSGKVTVYGSEVGQGHSVWVRGRARSQCMGQR